MLQKFWMPLPAFAIKDGERLRGEPVAITGFHDYFPEVKRSAHQRHAAPRGLAVASLLILTNCGGLTAAGLVLAWKAGNGAREWERIQDRIKDAGYSLNIAEIAAPPLPETGNFGAAPALHGIAAPPANQPAGIADRIAVLRGLDPRKPADKNPPSGKAPSLAKANMATLCHYFLDDASMLKAGDGAGLLQAQKARSEDPAHVSQWLAILLNADRMFADGADQVYTKLIPALAHQEMERRALVVACAVARHRLITGSLPEALTDIPKELLQENPKDLDGRQIHYRQLSAGWVIWSVGSDMDDDWHGEPPPESWLKTQKDEPAPNRYPDWQWHFKPK